MAKAFHFLLRRGSVILHPAVPPAMAKVGCSAASPRPARERDSHRAVAAVFFVVRSLPGTARFAFPFVDLFASWIRLVIAVPGIAADLSAVPGPCLAGAGLR